MHQLLFSLVWRQFSNSGGIPWMLPVPFVTGMTELLSLHQHMDSAVKSPHRNWGGSPLLWLLDDGCWCRFWMCISQSSRRAAATSSCVQTRRRTKQRNRRWQPGLHPADPSFTSQVNVILCQGLSTIRDGKRWVLLFLLCPVWKWKLEKLSQHATGHHWVVWISDNFLVTICTIKLISNILETVYRPTVK